MSEYDWKTTTTHWVCKQEKLAPSCWMFLCKRPEGYEALEPLSASMPWAHVYVFDRPVEGINKRAIIEHFMFAEPSPLEMYSIELEMRKQYATCPTKTVGPNTTSDVSPSE